MGHVSYLWTLKNYSTHILVTDQNVDFETQGEKNIEGKKN